MPAEIVDIKRGYYEYAVKAVCGVLKGTKALPLNSGTYYTAINIHNPEAKDTKFRVKIAVAGPGQGGAVSAFHQFSLKADQALEIDCELIHKFAELDPGTFVKGFAVVQSQTRLDIVGVYTVGGLDDPSARSLHLERVTGTLIKV